MSAIIGSNEMHAVFEVPSPDGEFPPAFKSYFRALGRKRRMLLLSFAPKAAGTFFRQAAMEAVGGYLLRLTHAQGGRDGTPYLPAFVAGFLDAAKPEIVAHIHMQALPANRRFVEMFGLKPVIMIRSIPDMLVSYWDMLETDAVARADGLNCLIPHDFLAMDAEEKADFMIEIVAPWYASYFATWKDFCDDAPETVLVLHYAEFAMDAAGCLARALSHAGYAIQRAACDAAVAKVWRERDGLRFNKGVGGRGAHYFSPQQCMRVRRLLSHYRQLEPWIDELCGAEPPAKRASDFVEIAGEGAVASADRSRDVAVQIAGISARNSLAG